MAFSTSIFKRQRKKKLQRLPAINIIFLYKNDLTRKELLAVSYQPHLAAGFCLSVCLSGLDSAPNGELEAQRATSANAISSMQQISFVIYK
jgi:hypothetical protein